VGKNGNGKGKGTGFRDRRSRSHSGDGNFSGTHGSIESTSEVQSSYGWMCQSAGLVRAMRMRRDLPCVPRMTEMTRGRNTSRRNDAVAI
jgi:ABC-type proline/glycine betaine transport system ATPase subunit